MSDGPPPWLPGTFDFSDQTDADVRELYRRFHRDLGLEPLMVGDRKLIYHGDTVMTEHGSFPRGFWHAVAREDRKTRERYLERKRARRVEWIAAILNNRHDPRVRWWRAIEKNAVRQYFWLESESFVVILEDLKNGACLLISAHYVDGDSTVRRLERSYGRRIQ